MDSLVQAADVAIRRTAVVRATMHANAVAQWLPGAFERVLRTLERQRIRPSGPPFARYTRRGELVEVEAGYATNSHGGGPMHRSHMPFGPNRVSGPRHSVSHAPARPSRAGHSVPALPVVYAWLVLPALVVQIPAGVWFDQCAITAH
jgi:hypothetical protein